MQYGETATMLAALCGDGEKLKGLANVGADLEVRDIVSSCNLLYLLINDLKAVV